MVKSKQDPDRRGITIVLSKEDLAVLDEAIRKLAAETELPVSRAAMARRILMKSLRRPPETPKE